MANIPATQYIKFFYDVDNIMKEIDNKFEPVNSALKAKGSEWIGLRYMRRWNPFRWAIQNADTNTPAKLGLPLELDNNFVILSQAATKSVDILDKDGNELIHIEGPGQNTYIGFKQEFYNEHIKKFIEKVSRYYYLYFDSPAGCKCFYGRLRPEKVEDDILNSGTGVDCDTPGNKALNDPKSKFFPLYTFDELITCDSTLYKCSVNSQGGWTGYNNEYKNYVFIKLDESDQGPFCDRQNIANNLGINVEESTLNNAVKYSTNMSIGPLGPISYSLYKNENNTNAVKEIRVDNNSDICFKDGDLYCCSDKRPELDKDLTYVGYVLKPRNGMKTLMTIAPESQDSFFMDLIAKFFANGAYLYDPYTQPVAISIPGIGLSSSNYLSYVSYSATALMTFSKSLYRHDNFHCREYSDGYPHLLCGYKNEEEGYSGGCEATTCQARSCQDKTPTGKITIIRFTDNLNNTKQLITNAYSIGKCNTIISGSCIESCSNCHELDDVGWPPQCDFEECSTECNYEYGIAPDTDLDIVIFPIHISLAVSSRTLSLKTSLFTVYLEALKNALNLLNDSLNDIQPKLSRLRGFIGYIHGSINDISNYYCYSNFIEVGSDEEPGLYALSYFAPSLSVFLRNNRIRVPYEAACPPVEPGKEDEGAPKYEKYNYLFTTESIDGCSFITLISNRNLKYHNTELYEFVPSVDGSGYSSYCKFTINLTKLGDFSKLDYEDISNMIDCVPFNQCHTCDWNKPGEDPDDPGQTGEKADEDPIDPDPGPRPEPEPGPNDGYTPNHYPPKPVDAVCNEAYLEARAEAENAAKQWYDGRYVYAESRKENIIGETKETEWGCSGPCYECEYTDDKGEFHPTRVVPCTNTLHHCDGYTVTTTYKYNQSCWASSGWQSNKWYWAQGSGAGGVLRYEVKPAHEVYKNFTTGPKTYVGKEVNRFSTSGSCG